MDPSGGVVHVWLVPADQPPSDVDRCRDVLDDGERARAAALRHDQDRDRFTVAHGALRMLVGRALDVAPAELAWTRGPHGKPALRAPVPPAGPAGSAGSGPYTNLSHSAALVLVAFSAERPVGVDVQHQATGLDPIGLSARYFPPDEARYVAAGADEPDRRDRFAHLWCRKEAMVKAAGERLWPYLGVGVRDRDLVECAGVHRLADVAVPAGFRAAVALAGAGRYRIDVRVLDTIG